MSQRDTLLIVDGMEINLAILNNIFEQDYNILEAEKNGFQVLSDMKRFRLLNELPVIIITAEDSPGIKVRSFDLGASDIIVKPLETYVVTRRVQNAIELNRYRLHLKELVEKQVEGQIKNGLNVEVAEIQKHLEEGNGSNGCYGIPNSSKLQKLLKKWLWVNLQNGFNKNPL